MEVHTFLGWIPSPRSPQGAESPTVSPHVQLRADKIPLTSVSAIKAQQHPAIQKAFPHR